MPLWQVPFAKIINPGNWVSLAQVSIQCIALALIQVISLTEQDPGCMLYAPQQFVYQLPLH